MKAVITMLFLFSSILLVFIPQVSAATGTEDFEDDSVGSPPTESWITYVTRWRDEATGGIPPSYNVSTFKGTKVMDLDTGGNVTHAFDVWLNFTAAQITNVSFDYYLNESNPGEDEIITCGVNNVDGFGGETFSLQAKETSDNVRVADAGSWKNLYVSDYLENESINVFVEFNWTTHKYNCTLTPAVTAPSSSGWVTFKDNTAANNATSLYFADGADNQITQTFIDNITINGLLVGDEEEEEEEFEWGPWSETWTISESHSCTGTGYTYGNWTDAEFVDDNTLDELWTEANDSHWEVNDSSAWWAGNRTYQTNYSLYNSSFTLLNDSGMNRTQLFGWVHNNGTNNYPYPFIIFAYNTSQDFDCLLWIENESHYMNVWILHWNGTAMLDHATGLEVEDPNENENATNIIDYNEWQGGYITTVGHYFKLIYNNYNGSIKFKWWDGDSFLTEPTGWATQYSHANITRSGPLCKGIGVWNPTAVGGFMQWDMFNVWQLNYTVNATDWINISDTNTSRPHMNFPVIDLGTWTEEIMSYFNATAEGNVSLGTIARVMKDNITNPMNLESRAFELKSLDNGQQNDTVYYYSMMIDNFTAFSEESYDEWLHLHVQMCPEDDIEVDEYGDFIVGIDIDNNRTWNANDRVYWAYANTSGLQWNETYDGTGNPKTNIAVWNIWESEDNAPGNLHRYTGHINYAISIPLADLIKDDGTPLNSTDVFGLSIITTTSGTAAALQDACVWQNWNETTESTYMDEENNLANVMPYFFNYGEEAEGPIPNATSLGRWGEGEIGAGLDASGEVSSAATINKTSNVTIVAAGNTWQLVNYSIWVNNTGAGSLTNVVVNDTKFNCSCHDFNETEFVASNVSWHSITNYSCYREFNITTIAPAGSWHIWYVVNITTCPSVTYGTVQNNASANATELSAAVTTNNQINWGGDFVRITYTIQTDAFGDANAIFNIIGIMFIIGSILAIVILVKRFGGF